MRREFSSELWHGGDGARPQTVKLGSEWIPRHPQSLEVDSSGLERLSRCFFVQCGDSGFAQKGGSLPRVFAVGLFPFPRVNEGPVIARNRISRLPDNPDVSACIPPGMPVVWK